MKRKYFFATRDGERRLYKQEATYGNMRYWVAVIIKGNFRCWCYCNVPLENPELIDEQTAHEFLFEYCI